MFAFFFLNKKTKFFLFTIFDKKKKLVHKIAKYFFFFEEPQRRIWDSQVCRAGIWHDPKNKCQELWHVQELWRYAEKSINKSDAYTGNPHWVQASSLFLLNLENFA